MHEPWFNPLGSNQNIYFRKYETYLGYPHNMDSKSVWLSSKSLVAQLTTHGGRLGGQKLMLHGLKIKRRTWSLNNIDDANKILTNYHASMLISDETDLWNAG